MDTPLYVLSTAASLIEHADSTNNSVTVNNGGLQYQGQDPPDPGPGTPTRGASAPTRSGLKQPSHHGNSYAQERKQYTLLMTSREEARKCTAGTQTSLTSFTLPPYRRPHSPRTSRHHGNEPSGGEDSPPPPPPYDYHHRANPTHTATFQPDNSHYDNMESDNVPLNLTISSASHQHHQAPRPSVITRANHSPMTTTVPQPHEDAWLPTAGSASQPPHQDACTGSNSLGSDDSGIEEHFRRSLGSHYPGYRTQHSHGEGGRTPSPENSPSAETDRKNVSITGNVDDHFAKSLGDAWTKLNVKQSSSRSEGGSGSVDDHFAKALGDTWYKIKAQTESGGGGRTTHTFSTAPPASTPVRL